MLKYLALSAALLLGACASLSGSGTGTAATALGTANQALTAAHDAHDGFAKLADALAVARVLHGDSAAKAKALLVSSQTILHAADKAAALGNATDVTAKVAAATALYAQITAILSGGI